jgi:hypothetical protein
MSEFTEDVFELERRVRALEIRQSQRELDDILRRIERLEMARGLGHRLQSPERDSR